MARHWPGSLLGSGWSESADQCWGWLSVAPDPRQVPARPRLGAGGLRFLTLGGWAMSGPLGLPLSRRRLGLWLTLLPPGCGAWMLLEGGAEMNGMVRRVATPVELLCVGAGLVEYNQETPG